MPAVAALSGFASARREDIRVNLGATTTMDVSLDMVRLGAIVTVKGGAGVVDRRATMVATVFDAGERPTCRALAPSARFSPRHRPCSSRASTSAAARRSRWARSAYTERAAYNRPTIEGISVSGMNPFGFALDYGTFTNVSVGTGAYGPEWSSPGLHMQFITKSGGNQCAGTFYAG